MIHISVPRYEYTYWKHESVCVYEKLGQSEGECSSFKLLNCKAITLVSIVLGEVGEIGINKNKNK